MQFNYLNLATLVLASSLGFNVQAAETNWAKIEQAAQGQTVYFNAWGGGENINSYIEWAAEQAKQRYAITVKQVKITDAAEVVKRIQTEQQAGRTTDGSVDLIWVNGENFSALKRGKLLYGPWAEQLPNWSNVDTNKPVRQDFSESTDGLEAPWGTAQLAFIADRSKVASAPDSATALLEFAKQNPGRISYPKPPSFHGTTFLKQLLLELSTDPSALTKPVDPAQFATMTKPLWDYLDQLHAVAWQQGKSFPASDSEMHQKLADGELLISLTFNPNEAASLIEKGSLPKTAYSFGFKQGTIGNVHFVAIPFNAKAKEAAQIFANFLLSPEAQAHKADVKVWGDPSVLLADKLPAASQEAATASTLPADIPTLAEPHASWVETLEKEWLQRYGS
jgi:putative thiamine transport system substrate-binding protein